MLADCSACDPRNPFPGQVLPSRTAANLHSSFTEIDYKDRDVSVETVMQVLIGHHPPGTPASRRLNSDANSTVLLYLTGHGGDGFLKFHDQTELLATDLAAAIKSMHSARRYKELLLVLDTCQAATLYSELDAIPNWAGIASSKLGQSSYALRSDPGVGAHLVDEFSHYLATYLDRIDVERLVKSKSRDIGGGAAKKNSESRSTGGGPSLEDMISSLRANKMSSEIAIESSKLGRPLHAVKVLDFFGDMTNIDNSEGLVPLRSGNQVKVAGVMKAKNSSGPSNGDVKPRQQEERGEEADNSISLYDMLLQAWP
jgi:glycosylphosphatidylinositol transamidase (GPIT) subunit GPI8